MSSLSHHKEDLLIDLSEDSPTTPTPTPMTATTIGSLEDIPLTPAPPRVPIITTTTTTPLATSIADISTIPVMSKAEAAAQWEKCRAEALDEIRYPRVASVHSPFRSFEAMLEAQRKGDYNEVNTMQYPNGPTKEHISLIQRLYHQRGMPLEQIAGILVEAYPQLEKGVKSGKEVERRDVVLGMVNLWVSIWAERYD